MACMRGGQSHSGKGEELEKWGARDEGEGYVLGTATKLIKDLLARGMKQTSRRKRRGT